MHFAGIIAEYDPFHNGHAWQLAAARALGARRVAVALSCGLTQRGAPSLLPEAVRVEAALQAGADLVFALPAPWAMSGAESFARAGVALLAAAGCDALVFGAETPDPALLTETARVLASADYRAALRRQLEGGAPSFAAARQAAVGQAAPGAGLDALLDKPNNNLAVEYCKAILELDASLAPVPLPRQGVGHGQALPAAGPYASASALRALWAKEGPDALAPYIPAAALPLYRTAHAAGADTDRAAVSLAVLSRLRGRAGLTGFAGVRGLSEGLEHRLDACVRQAATLDGLCDALTNVRYPRARMRRLTLDAALGYGGPDAPAGWLAIPDLPPYLHLLGGRRDAIPLLAGAALPASPSLAKLARANDTCARTAQAQAAAADLAALCRRTPAPMGTAYTTPLVKYPR